MLSRRGSNQGLDNVHHDVPFTSLTLRVHLTHVLLVKRQAMGNLKLAFCGEREEVGESVRAWGKRWKTLGPPRN